MSVKESVAVVTGANRGMGLETCRRLLGRGLRVVMTGRDEYSLQRARQGFRQLPGELIAVRMDVTDAASIEAAHRTIHQRFGVVDVLVNNAAVLLFEDSDVLSIPADGFRRTFETNVFGVIDVCRVFVPPMADRGHGRVVNVSSGAGAARAHIHVRASLLDLESGTQCVHVRACGDVS